LGLNCHGVPRQVAAVERQAVMLAPSQNVENVHCGCSDKAHVIRQKLGHFDFILAVPLELSGWQGVIS